MTRYYRAPEIIFQQRKYDQKTDLWSFGCVASQLLQHMVTPEKQLKEKILFRGKSCFPLSPDPDGDQDDENEVSSRDQTVHILQVLGNEQELPNHYFYKNKMNIFY